MLSTDPRDLTFLIFLMNRFAILACLLFSWLVAPWPLITRVNEANGQEAEPTIDNRVDSPPVGETAAPTNPPRLIRLSVGGEGTSRYVSGKWANLSVNAGNSSADDVVETATVTVGTNANIQYARKLWIPAGARRTSWLPIRVPDRLPRTQTHVPYKTIHLKESSGGEQFHANVTGMSVTTSTLMLANSDFETGLFIDNNRRDREGLEQIQTLRNVINLGNGSVGIENNKTGMAEFHTEILPPAVNSFDALDQIVISNDALLADSDVASRLQSWLRSGGQIWIMADLVSPATVRMILGDVAAYEIVDRVELTEFQIQGKAKHRSIKPPEPESWNSESPVELLRVFVENDRVDYRIDGWPAAFWTQIGRGQVLITTLGASGWLNQNKPLLAYKDLANEFFIRKPGELDHTEAIIPFLDKEIGYEIPRRSLIATALGLHALLLLVLGIWFAKAKRLSRLAWAVPVISISVAGYLIFVSNRQTQAIPSTVAMGQIVRVNAETSTAQIDSVAAIYCQESRPLLLQSRPGTSTELRESNDTGDIKRMIFTDDGRSGWGHVRQPPGVVRHVASKTTMHLPEPWAIHGRFTKQGFEGTVKGLTNTDGKAVCEDAVVIGATVPTLGLTAVSGNRLVGDTDSLLASGQYMAGTLLSDEQRDRQSLLRELLSPGSPLRQSKPSVLAWTNPIETGVDFGEDFTRRGSALTSLPIQLHRTESGSQFMIPATFIDMQPVTGSGGESVAYDALNGEWLRNINKAILTELRCKLPQVVVPCKLSGATLSLRINAPSRTLEVKSLVDGKYVSVYKQSNPNGLIKISIPKEDIEVDRNGISQIAVSVSGSSGSETTGETPLNGNSVTTESTRAIDQNPAPDQNIREQATPDRNLWHIEYLRINFEGTTL